MTHDYQQTQDAQGDSNDSQLPYQTRPCRYFFRASGCRDGDNCTFNHDTAFRQEYLKLRTCKSYSRGNCKAGDECLYSHVGQTAPDEGPVAAPVHQKSLKETPLHQCPNDGCPNMCKGQQCVACHNAYVASIPCRPWFKGGFCKFGTTCRFSHDDQVNDAYHGLHPCANYPNCPNKCTSSYRTCRECRAAFEEEHPYQKCTAQGCLEKTRYKYCRSCFRSYGSSKQN